MRQLNRVGVLGAGQMGAEIALCFAACGVSVVMREPDLPLAEQGKARIGKVLDKAVAKGRFPAEERDAVLALVMPTADYEPFVDADLVVEAVFENIELKKSVLEEADEVCKRECIIATNTSSIPITLLSTAVGENRRPLFIGMHFLLPLPL